MSRLFTVDDIPRIRGVGEVQISPDGSKVLYTVRSVNLAENKYVTDIYIVPVEGGEPRQLTAEGNASMASWSPCGRWIAYVQSGKDASTITVMNAESGEKRKIIDYNVSNASLGMGAVGSAVKWSPDGRHLAYLASLEPVDREAKIKVVTRILYKSFYGWSDMRRRHIFTVSVLGGEAPRQLTYGDYDEHSIDWSPDGREIAFISNRTGRDDFDMHTDIYAVDIESREIRRITESVGAEYNPTYSPDGSMIAYLATTRGNTSNESTPEDHHLWVVDRDGGNPRDASGSLDRPVNGPPAWLSNSEILVTCSDEARTPILRVSVSGEVTKIREGDRSHGKLSAAQNGAYAYTVTDPTHPEDIYVSYPGGEEAKLTDLNTWLRDLMLAYPEEFRFTGGDGTPLHGFIVKPSGMEPGKRYPTLLNIKGGPSGMHGYSWNSYHQLAPASGYVQVYVNYRGCSGYGQRFTDAIVGDMLGGEYRDNVDVLDYTIRAYPYIDPERVGVYGGSYGGYLTNWAITQTQRFKAAVAISSISNLWSQWGCSAIPGWTEVELPGLPWEKKELMMRQSPIWEAEKARTPTLFLHGELDHDTPICEAEQMFMALRKNGVEAVLVRYTDDGHGIRVKPANTVDAMRRVFDWFSRHI